MIYISVFHAAGAGGGGGGNFPAGITSGAPADAIVNASVDGLDTRDFVEVFNGTTWDRIRTVSAGNSTAGTGILGAGILFADTVNGLYRQWPAAVLGDALDGSGIPSTGVPYIVNGGTIDRLRSASALNATAGTGLLGVGPLFFDSANSIYRRFLAANSAADALDGSTIPISGSIYIYNGTTYDRIRGANSSTGTTGTGVQGVSVMGFDATNYRRISTANGVTADANNGAGSLSIAPVIFNGANYDRVRGGTDSAALIGSQRVINVAFLFNHIVLSTTTTVKSGAGIFHTLSINTKGVGGTATLFDNTAGSGTSIAVIDTTLGIQTFTFDLAFATGLTIVTTGATPADITVTYR
jgi:hypothetical protein